jgi:hypothetical protein
MVITPAKRSLRLRASAEAFEVLRESKSPKIPNAELLKHSVRADHEPHPRVVREVHGALLEARASLVAQARQRSGPLKKISGIFSRRTATAEPETEVDDVVKRFERAFIDPD